MLLQILYSSHSPHLLCAINNVTVKRFVDLQGVILRRLCLICTHRGLRIHKVPCFESVSSSLLLYDFWGLLSKLQLALDGFSDCMLFQGFPILGNPGDRLCLLVFVPAEFSIA